MNSELKAPGTKRSKLKHDELLSRFPFKFDLRHYTAAPAQPNMRRKNSSRGRR